MGRTIRSAQSDEDLIAIWQYIARDNPKAATRFIEAIERRYEQLADFPFLGETQPQFGEKTRRLIVGNYLVYYDVLDDAVHILRVFHSARKIEELFD